MNKSKNRLDSSNTRRQSPWTWIIPLAVLLAMVAAVLAYGSVMGGAIAWAGMLLAASLGYAIRRLLGHVSVDRKSKE